MKTTPASYAVCTETIDHIREALQGCPYQAEELMARVTAAAGEDGDAVTGTELRIQTGRDIAELIRAQIP